MHHDVDQPISFDRRRGAADDDWQRYGGGIRGKKSSVIILGSRLVGVVADVAGLETHCC